jgi:predicted nucleic acid-binding protein
VVVETFVDANVLIYAVDDRDPGKRDRARAWLAACWRLRCGRLSTQVLNEFYVNVRRKFAGTVSAGDARAEIRRYQLWRPWTIDHQTVEAAWAVETRHRINYWDALMVAAAQQQSCTLLLTEDLQHDQTIDGVRVVDPFQLGPELLEVAIP